jgi:ATP-dependent DNA helicase RecG
MELGSPVTDIKGVGEKTAELLRKAGLLTVRDLMYYFPRSYDDFTETRYIEDIKPGKVILRAKVEKATLSRKRRGLTLVEATLTDKTGSIKAVWFNQPYRAKQFQPGKEYFFSGVFGLSYGRYQLMNPSAEIASEYDGLETRITPIYKACGGLKSKMIAKILTNFQHSFSNIEEVLPSATISGSGMLSRRDALYKIHFPEAEEDIKDAKTRLGFDELFELILASKLNKIDNQKLKSRKIDFNLEDVKKFIGKLPFQLTNSQRLAAWEIIQDFGREMPMNRILQGDVGSGKTVVAGLAAYQASVSGYQTALMAPTEILAFQHAETMRRLLKPFGITVAVLTGSTKNKQVLHRSIENGDVDVIVGTHALISEKVKFHKLGFVVIDEQHRFGVKQRQALIDKTDGMDVMPHLLSMTATPIPRSLQLTLFGEMDVSVLNELPKGRKPIATKILSPNLAETVFAKIKEELEKGRQAYYVCSQINENEEVDLKNVQKEYRHLKKIFCDKSVGLLHGKMKSTEKDATMGEFLSGKIDVLVSTTVVEVGVDVPNATLIVIRDADRFGLSQLHQLRGRVGRSEHQSYCYLVTTTSAKPTQRLRELEGSNDGFYLAEKDLELRGPGEIYGNMQHGELNLKLASISDMKLVREASRAADRFLKSDDSLLNYSELASAIYKYQRLTTLN